MEDIKKIQNEYRKKKLKKHEIVEIMAFVVPNLCDIVEYLLEKDK